VLIVNSATAKRLRAEWASMQMDSARRSQSWKISQPGSNERTTEHKLSRWLSVIQRDTDIQPLKDAV
jgi:hypothetical protein